MRKLRLAQAKWLVTGRRTQTPGSVELRILQSSKTEGVVYSSTQQSVVSVWTQHPQPQPEGDSCDLGSNSLLCARTPYCPPPPLPLLPSTFGLLEEEVRALRGAVPFPASTAAGQGWNPDAWISGGAAESFPHLEMLRLSPHSSSLCEFVYCLSSSLEGQSQVGLVP